MVNFYRLIFRVEYTQLNCQVFTICLVSVTCLRPVGSVVAVVTLNIQLFSWWTAISVRPLNRRTVLQFDDDGDDDDDNDDDDYDDKHFYVMEFCLLSKMSI